MQLLGYHHISGSCRIEHRVPSLFSFLIPVIILGQTLYHSSFRINPLKNLKVVEHIRRTCWQLPQLAPPVDLFIDSFIIMVIIVSQRSPNEVTFVDY